MSAPTTARQPGRPKGITKSKPGLTIDRKLVLQAKKIAWKQNMSLSAYVERALATYINEQKP